MPKIKPVKIDVTDKYRVLLTDLLPYEVPLWFTNEFFYNACKQGEHKGTNTPLGLLLASVKEYTIPLTYSVKKDDNGIRCLSIIHPATQLRFVDFYNDYEWLIPYYCQISEKSLRAPVRLATKFYERGSQDFSVGVEEEDRPQKYCSSHFIYRQFGFLYQFFESYEFHSLEQKFSKLVQLDIAKCFNHIYTHSISWAVKTKDFAKKHSGKKFCEAFDRRFDSLMQDSNYSETNGILIGPEVSRIFAEIILQKLDMVLIKELEDKEKLKANRDFDFRRYVDDYFFFFNDEETMRKICEALQNCLGDYKLYLNESKARFSNRPFISNISLCKMDLSDTVKSLFEGFCTEKADKIVLKAPSGGLVRFANKRIAAIKATLKRHNVGFKSISGFFFFVFNSQLKKYFRLIQALTKDTDIKVVCDQILALLDILFFVYAMDKRVRSTDLMTLAISRILDKTDALGYEEQYLIKKKIFDAARRIFDSHNEFHDGSAIELLNLLLVLTLLGNDFLLEEEKLVACFKPERIEGLNGYFIWVSLMLYVRDHQKYNQLRNEMFQRACNRIAGASEGFKNAELFMFFLDLMSCPWLNEKDKRTFLLQNSALGASLPKSQQSCAEFVKKITNGRFFVDWNDINWAKARMEKKKFTFSYA